MLFIATDMKKFQNLNVHHVLYRNSKDPECPFLTLRISGFRPDYSYNYVKVQILSFVFRANENLRLIAVSKLQVLGEADLKIPKSSLNPSDQGHLPLNLSHLIIKRISQQPMKEFKIFYHSCN